MIFRDSDALLAALVASSDDAIISKDLNGIITTWNEAAERMFGYTAAEAIGQSVTTIIPENRLGEEEFVLNQVRKGIGISHFETLRRRRDGTLVEVSVTVSPIRDANGRVMGASKIVRDITFAKRIEREALRLAAIVEWSDDAIASKDLNGVIQTWNKAAERMFGFTAEEAIGQSITIIIPEDRLSEETEVLTRIRTGLSVEHFETVRQRKDGQLVDIALTVSPIRTHAGVVIGASKIARDISEQKRLRTVADEASRLKDEFLAVLSHELRTPLNTVLGYARMLRRDDLRLEGEARVRALEALERNVDTLSRLVNDVLDTSRIVTGKLRLTMQTCAIAEVIQRAFDIVGPAAEVKGIVLEAHFDPGATVAGDADRLQQVLWNLLSNAVKFTPSGGSIVVSTHRRAGDVVIVVQDTGIGISAEHLPYVFQRFWQAHTGVSREFGGLGIGLALARHIIELHGGTIKVESAGVGRGATFTITLPSASAILARERHLRPVAKS
jgi:PAS domain S-box-containing protein